MKIILIIIILTGLGFLMFNYLQGNFPFQKKKQKENNSNKRIYSKCYKKDVCVGDVWEWINEDPFSDLKIIKYLVLNVKDSYVKFERSGPTIPKTIDSDSINLFVCNKNLISRKEETSERKN